MDIDTLIAKAFEEDHGSGDHTSLSTIPKSASGRATLTAKEAGIISGVIIARKVFQFQDTDLSIEVQKHDGEPVAPGDTILIVEGSASSILQAERLALNFLQRMSGIASKTQEYAEAIKGFPAKILDTRKTTPLMRQLEKQAVRDGGGYNHRMGLYDMMMIKDNHIDFAGSIAKAIDAAQLYQKKEAMSLPIEIEVRNFSELQQVLDHGHINRIMLDNFSPKDLTKAVGMIDKQYETEASGGITLESIRDYAASGVDYISVGALTHHIKSLDMSLNATF